MFDLFSERNLHANADLIDQALGADCDAVFFRGTTPWIGSRPRVPYFAYTDMCFHTYFHNTFPPRAFLPRDLDRIWESEARWLEAAHAVFFESAWGAEKTKQAYGLAGGNFVPIGRGGHVPIPAADVYEFKHHHLVSIAKDFRQKGGDLIWDAFLTLKPRFPDLEWHIIGGKPDRPWTHIEGLHYHGFLSKTDAAHLGELRSVLEQAFLLVHPTREDSSPLVISEAGYFGCPSISVNQFAIPELIRHGETGLLLEPPVQAERLATAIESLIQNPDAYREMRRKARAYALEHANWDVIGEKMVRHIDSCLALQKTGKQASTG
jgi:glycosyltransferase involved in cell wall biosynthesis